MLLFIFYLLFLLAASLVSIFQRTSELPHYNIHSCGHHGGQETPTDTCIYRRLFIKVQHVPGAGSSVLLRGEEALRTCCWTRLSCSCKRPSASNRDFTKDVDHHIVFVIITATTSKGKKRKAVDKEQQHFHGGRAGEASADLCPIKSMTSPRTK